MARPEANVVLDIIFSELYAGNLRGGRIPAKLSEQLNLVFGTTDGQIDKGYVVSESGKAASSTTQYDLAAGSIRDIDGNVVTFVEVCLIAVRNTRTTAGAVIDIGPHTANGFGVLAGGKGFWNAAHGAGGGQIVAENSGWTVMYSPIGVPVTAGTADILSVICSAVVGDTNSWDLVILGRSA
jgi:hypothetical protein